MVSQAEHVGGADAAEAAAEALFVAGLLAAAAPAADGSRRGHDDGGATGGGAPPPRRAGPLREEDLATPAAAALADVTSVDDLLLGQEVGAGSTSTVHTAVVRGSRTVVAVKAISRRRALSVKMAQHLLSERALLSEPRLHHACVYRCYCTLRDEDNVYYVTELMPRGTAHDHVRALNARQGTNTGTVRYYAGVAVVALEHFARHGVLFRDLKLSNVMVDWAGRAKLIDLGLSKQLVVGGPGCAEGGDAASHFFGGGSGGAETLRTCTLCGTPHCWPPEAVGGAPDGQGPCFTLASDRWSLGVFLFELLHGFPPFFAEGGAVMSPAYAAKLRAAPSSVPFPPLCTLDASRCAPEELEAATAVRHPSAALAHDLIARLLVANPAERLPFEGVKAHAYFAGVDWSALAEGRARMPSPPPLDERVEAMLTETDASANGSDASGGGGGGSVRAAPGAARAGARGVSDPPSRDELEVRRLSPNSPLNSDDTDMDDAFSGY